MKRISFWARNNRKKAWLIITLAMLSLCALGTLLGLLLEDSGISLPLSFLILFAMIYLAGFIIYPSKSLKGNKLNQAVFYTRRKGIEFLVATAAFAIVVYVGNHADRIFHYSPAWGVAMASSLPADHVARPYKTLNEFAASMRDKDGKLLKWKERKKLLREQVRAIKGSSGLSKEEKTGLIILSVIVALALLALVAALSCNISCGGSGALAAIVALGGTALIVILLVRTIRKINGKKGARPKTAEGVPQQIP